MHLFYVLIDVDREVISAWGLNLYLLLYLCIFNCAISSQNSLYKSSMTFSNRSVYG